ncbi:MAG TPA: MFS transporter [Burkholderiaceae bacterium]|nr:MFS transporter [Burkholderiaceae bacterium]
MSANPAAGALSEPHDEPRYGWVVVWATFVALAVIFGVAYSFAAFFEPFVRDFQAQRADVSLVFGLCGLIYFVLGAFGGMLSDRLGPRVVVGAGMVCITLGLLGAAAAGSMTTVTLAYGIGVGVGIALVYTPAIGTVQPWFTRRRGLAAGIASAGIGAGTLVVPLLAAAAIAAWRWRGAMTALALGTLLLGFAATLLIRRAPAAAKRSDGSVPGTSLKEALRGRTFAWLYAMCALGAFSMFIPFAHLSAAARDLGVPDARAVGLVGLIGIGSLSGRFVIGALADRVGRPRTLVIAQASLGASFVLWALADGYLALAAFALWMGTSYGGIVSLMPALCMDRFGARAVSSIIGTLYSGAAIGNLAGPWLAGRIFDANGNYAIVTWGCMALSALATLCTWQALRR